MRVFINYLASWLVVSMSLLQRCNASHAADSAEKPEVTSAAAIHAQRRQDGKRSNFLGYAPNGGEWYPRSCAPGYTLYLSESWGGCKAVTATSFDVATACSDGSIMICPTTAYTCGSPRGVCASIFLYDDLDDVEPYSMYGCNGESAVVDLYVATALRHEFSAATQSSSSSMPLRTSTSGLGSTSSSASSRSSTTSSTTSSMVQTTLPTQSESSTSSNSGTQQNSGRNMAWVAGPIAGGIGGVIIIALLAWITLLLRKRRKGQAAIEQQGFQGSAYQPEQPHQYQWKLSEQQKPGEYAEVYADFRRPAELHETALPGELQGQANITTNGFR